MGTEPENKVILVCKGTKPKKIVINGAEYACKTNEQMQNFAKNNSTEAKIFLAAKNKNEVITMTPKEYKRYKNGKGSSKTSVGKVIWSAAVAVAIVGTAIVTYLMIKKNANAAEKEATRTTPDQENEVKDENKDVDSKIALLKEGLQKDSFKTMNDLSKYFNGDFANQIYPYKDGNKPYLTAKEIVALFTLANSKTYTPEQFYEIFSSSVYLGDVYNTVKDIPLETYYMFMKKDLSGIGNLFANEKDREYYNNFEQLVIKFNTAKTSEDKETAKKEINEYLHMICDLPEENYAVAELILLKGGNYAEIIGAITNEEHNAIRQGRQNDINCNVTESLIEIRTDVSTYSAEKGLINYTMIKELVGDPKTDAHKKDKNSLIDASIDDKVKGRDLNLALLTEATTEEEKKLQEEAKADTKNEGSESEKGSSDKESSQTPAEQKNVQTSETSTQNREDVAQQFSESEIKEAEKTAQEQATVEITKEDGTKETVSIDEANAKEEAYAKGYVDGYNAAYTFAREKTVMTGTKPSLRDLKEFPLYNGDYIEAYYGGYREGERIGIEYGYADGIIEYEAKNSKSEETAEVVTEYIPEPANQGNDTQTTTYTETTSGDTSDLEVTVETEEEYIPEEDLPADAYSYYDATFDTGEYDITYVSGEALDNEGKPLVRVRN